MKTDLALTFGIVALAVLAVACARSSPAPGPGTGTALSSPRSVASPPAPGAGPLPEVPFEEGDRTRGEKLFSSVGCIGCHTVKGVGGNVGPDLSAVASRAPGRARAQGLDRPELYFVQSVVYPRAYVVQGFNPVMPDWKQMQLTEKDLADLVAFLKTLTGQ